MTDKRIVGLPELRIIKGYKCKLNKGMTDFIPKWGLKDD